MTSRYDSTYKSIAALIIFAHSRIHQAKPGMAGKVSPPPPWQPGRFSDVFSKDRNPLSISALRFQICYSMGVPKVVIEIIKRLILRSPKPVTEVGLN